MAQDFYPSQSQLVRRLYAMSVVAAPVAAPEDMLDFESACAAAADAWEDMTGYTPFLAQSIDSTHYFHPDGSPTVDLQGGFVSITSVSINGNAATLNTDYRTYPLNALTNSKPITYLKFDLQWGRFISLFAPVPGQAAPVSVTGKRGAYAILPALAYEGILAIAICSLLGTFEYSQFGGVSSWKSGTTEEKYDMTAFARLDMASQGELTRAVRAFRRWKIG